MYFIHFIPIQIQKLQLSLLIIIIKEISQIYIVACGSAYHVGITAQYVIEDLAKIPVRVELGSEFRYRKPLLDAIKAENETWKYQMVKWYCGKFIEK